MDVGTILLGMTVGTIVARRFPNEQRLLTISIVLSVAISCSSILQLIPQHLSLYFKGNILQYLYDIILLAVNFHCIIVLPTAVCLSMAPSITILDEEEHKKRSFRRNHWLKCYMYRPLVTIFGTVLQRILACLPFLPSNTTSTLPTVKSPTKQPSLLVLRQRVLYAMLIGSSVTFFAVSRLRQCIIILRNTDQEESLFQIATSSLCAFGILLSAILNGFGSVSLPYTLILGFCVTPVSDTAIRNAEHELEQVRLRLESRNPVRRNASSDSAVMDAAAMEERHMAESDFLLALLADLAADLEEMKYVQKYGSQRGMIRRIAGTVCLILLMIRWSIAVRNICCDDTAATSSTPVLQQLFPSSTEEDEPRAQVISVILTAILSVTQLRTFVNVATALQRRVLQTCCSCTTATKHPTHTYLTLAIGFCLNCYSLACVVLTKQTLGIFDIFPFRTNRLMFDVTFASSALVSAAVLATVLGIWRANSQRYMTAEKTSARSGLVEV